MNLIKIAQETQQITKQKYYVSPNNLIIDLGEDINCSISNSIYYQNDLPEITNQKLTKPTFEVLNETTTQAATRLLSQGKSRIVALNFASSHTPGGAWLHGAQAQEEDLARCSALAACLKRQTSFYNNNILNDDSYYTDGMIYSPNVPFFRDHSLNLLEIPYYLSIITAPAPNISAMYNPDEQKLNEIFAYRTRKILQIAAKHGHKNLILGAWGCGVFGNNPSQVATAFVEAIQDFQYFDHICFAVYDRRSPPLVFETFKQIITPNK